LNRPGGNITGITVFNTLLSAKALGLLHELVPNAAVIAMMMNPKLPESARTLSDVEEAARTLGRKLLVLNASVPSEIDTAFATLRQQRADEDSQGREARRPAGRSGHEIRVRDQPENRQGARH